ncbi:alpha-1-antitrypsin-like protein GS55-MS [Bombina bombina]|uniref:alpha-1-antitrypsin-like protein GS55-MS n=1 Tax=Bombina bombina TaxID=8345 RepID=UPI00235A9A11|nr:alpha-1-antitrypsin-like protein GS55-MS [Bombina bombina]XP_053553489.1 alpha-1-antitrypsin-like protein GS55-MS [Bombina bombina]
MRSLVIWCLSFALFYALVFADHHGHDHSHEDDHNHKDNHRGHKYGHRRHKHHHHDHQHGKEKHRHKHHHNESMDCHKIATSNAEFAFNLYRQIASEQPAKNIFFSPLSISTAFSMLSLGARSQSFDQLIEGLGFNISKISEEDIHEGFHHLLHVLNDPDSELQVNTGNALFIHNKLKLLEAFLEDVKNLYQSEAFSTDFQNADDAKSQINGYVEKKTNGKIVDLLKSVDQNAALVLINYIYFRGKWEDPFREENTNERDFNVDEKTVVKVPMMYRHGYYNVLIDEKLGCTVVELPYKGNASALFILPDQGKLNQVEEALQKSTLKNWKKSMRESSIDLWIPKFSISASLDLIPELRKLGVTDIFSDQADLSGITGEKNLIVSKALHKAVLSVDESGSEAAGATALGLRTMSLSPSVVFNRTFLIVFYHRPTRSLPFIGKIVNPTA